MPLTLNRLNAPQRQAVLHGEGPLLVLAGAGSGKTSTMAYRIAHLISDRGVPARSVLGLSFTNKAARELRERVVRLITETSGRAAAQGLLVSTFHSLCVRMLRAHASRLGFQSDSSIVDENDQVDILRQVLRRIHIDDRRFDPARILFEIGQAKNRLLNREEAEAYFLESGRLSSDYSIAAASAFGAYQDQLKVLNAMDFDDLIYRTVELLDGHEVVRKQYNDRFRYILVDEYQDTNPSQFRILSALTRRSQNLCVVGDDDQSIYAWRGADPTHILEFAKHYPAARTIALEQNYRSTGRILEAANEVIAGNPKRYPKKLWSGRGEGTAPKEVILEDDPDEATWVAEEILRRVRDERHLFREFAVLYRSNAQSRIFEQTFRQNRIPYQIVGGMSFLDRKEVKNALAYWRLIANLKDDSSCRRILNWPARKIGRKSVEVLGEYAFNHKIPFFEGLGAAADQVGKASDAVLGFRKTILALRHSLLNQKDASVQSVSEWARHSLDVLGIRKAIDDDSDDAVVAVRKWENVEELVHSIGQMKLDGVDTLNEGSPADHAAGGAEAGHSWNGMQILQEFLTRMLIEEQEEEDDKDKESEEEKKKNEVTLLTLHGSKGLEFPIVFLVGMEEGFLPHKRTIEEATDFGEERRLCYVGITRAQDDLYLTRVRHRIRYGKPVPRTPSRFLGEIPEDLLERIDRSSTPDLSSGEAQKAHEDKVKGFLSQIQARLAAARQAP